LRWRGNGDAVAAVAADAADGDSNTVAADGVAVGMPMLPMASWRWRGNGDDVAADGDGDCEVAMAMTSLPIARWRWR
jgi:anti-sigma factor ChrR (cupin superfamily)